MSDSAEFAIIMGPVSREIFGEFGYELNKHMSSASEERYGKKGSIAVDLQKGVYADHEDGGGGGVLDLLRAFKGFEKPEAIEWLQDRGYLKKRERETSGAKGVGNGAPTPDPRGLFAGFMKDWPIAIYEYHDDKGALAYEVLKFSKEAPRRYMQRRPHPKGGWIWGLSEGLYGRTRGGDWFKAKSGKHYEEEQHFDDVKWFLYRRAEVVAAIAAGRPVVLVEGEKDVETLRAWGITATTNQGGAKNWRPELNPDLFGADIILCSDNDDAGRARTLLRGADLKGIAKRVRVLDIAQHWKDAPEKADVTDWRDAAGGTKEQFETLMRKAPVWKPEAPKSRYGAFTFDQLDSPGMDYDYIVDGWLTERGRSVLGGPSGSGKSFLAMHIAMCVARGQDFFAYPVKRAGVIYQAGEGGHGVKKRFRAYRQHFAVPEDADVPLVVLPAKVDLFSKEGDTRALIDEIKSWQLVMTYPLGLVVIDTLATATIGADENSGKDMSVVLANIAQIEHECGVHVMLVHHMNADGKKLRGHTSIHANVDQVILVTNDEGLRTAKLVKQKDDEDGLKINFALASVNLGPNPKTQRDITSCVVLTVSEKEKLKREQERQGFSVSPTEREIMQRIFEAVDKYGKFIADEKDGPREAVGKHVVDFRYYLDVCVEKMVEVDDKSKARDRASKTFARSSRFLQNAGIISTKRPYVWWNGKPIRGFARTFPKGQTPDETGTIPGQTPTPPLSPDVEELINSGEEIQF